jgi:hypothetical protein
MTDATLRITGASAGYAFTSWIGPAIGLRGPSFIWSLISTA